MGKGLYRKVNREIFSMVVSDFLLSNDLCEQFKAFVEDTGYKLHEFELKEEVMEQADRWHGYGSQEFDEYGN